jgi:lipopolysaccharide transport system ATP-binding protein
MSTVIKVENISKQYRLGDVGTGALAHDVNKWWHKVRGKEDPYLKIGETNDRATKGESDYVWALKDINFEVKQGEVLGIIGRNGAGKSTLLKILSKTTTPTTGNIKIKGRIASLLEVGTGFHPELSGRENIFLNGAILGMTKREIKSRFDEIVDFAGVERYIDTPVKRYSSGMYVRLAFGVAAHLEPEILIVDEVLAVGDAEFQKKALGKMKDVSEKGGRTVLFVSHNMGAISSLCNKALLLKEGALADAGNPDDMISSYLQITKESVGSTYDNTAPKSEQKLKIRGVKIVDSSGTVSPKVNRDGAAFVDITLEVLKEGRGYDIGLELAHTQYGSIFCTSLKDTNLESFFNDVLAKGIHVYRLLLPLHYLRTGNYFIKVAASIPKIEILDIFMHETQFLIEDKTSPISITTEGRGGAILPIITWEEI